jgi:hypothetical protein
MILHKMKLAEKHRQFFYLIKSELFLGKNRWFGY